MKLLFTTSTFALLLLASPMLQAQSSLAAQLEQCRSEQNALKRLVCYDEINLRTAGSAATPAPQAAERARQATTATPATDNFGKEHRQVAADPLDQLYATVTKLSLSPRKEMIIELDNGQIWRQSGSGQFPLQNGERIYIKRGMLGAFYLGKDGSNRTLKVVRSN